MKIPHLYLLVVPAAIHYFGILLNALVLAANNGQMPVLYPGGCEVNLTDIFIHTCMLPGSHLKFLADWMVINHVGIVSPGDLCIWSGTEMIIPALVAWACLMIHEHERSFHF
jgi:hypothetical protein